MTTVVRMRLFRRRGGELVVQEPQLTGIRLDQVSSGDAGAVVLRG